MTVHPPAHDFEIEQMALAEALFLTNYRLHGQPR